MKNLHIEKEEEFMRKNRNCAEPLYHQFNKWLEKFMGDSDRKLKIIDIGCGNGNILSIMKRMGFRNVTGVEISEQMIKQSKKYAKIVKHDLEYPLPFHENIFDIAIADNVCEHIINMEQLISEINRILKPGGILIIGGPNLKSLYHRLRILSGNTNHISINFGIAHMRWVSYDIFEKMLNPYFDIRPVIFQWYAKLWPNLLARSCNMICTKKSYDKRTK